MSDKNDRPKIGTKEYEAETKKIAEEFLDAARKAGPLKDEHGIVIGNVKSLTGPDSELFPDEQEPIKK